MQRRNKTGGIKDRRFGENDPTMTPEERALERFTRDKQREHKKGSLFDLEDDEGEGELTHLGQSLALDNGKPGGADDFDEADLVSSEGGEEDENEDMNPRKRRRLSVSGSEEDLETEDNQEPLPGRKKSKAEVMKEVIAKSKLHKYERQQVKEDDDDLRAELDKGLPDLFALMRGQQPVPAAPAPPTIDGKTSMNPDRAALLNGKDRLQADKEYDERLRQMAYEKRAAPTERTMTEEEKAVEDAKRLKELDQERTRRMKGEESSEEDTGDNERNPQADGELDPEMNDAFGLGSGISNGDVAKVFDVEDEDDFLIEDDLIASSSDVLLSEDENDSEKSAHEAPESDDEREFVRGLLSKEDAGRFDSGPPGSGANAVDVMDRSDHHVAYTYPCPQSHEELLEVFRNVPFSDLPVIVQRIRALYHPKAHADNKAKLGVFAVVLVEHIAYLANQPSHPPFAVLETLVRHIHSLAKSYPEDIGRAFRSQLRSLHAERSTTPIPGDLVILTAIASIFPTSDHFHSVVTPAILSMARYLGQKIPQNLSDLAVGTYFETLCLQYQTLSKRFVPEVLNYALNALYILAPFKPGMLDGYFPYHEPTSSVRLQSSAETPQRRLQFWDILPRSDSTVESDAGLKLALLGTQLDILDATADLWVRTAKGG